MNEVRVCVYYHERVLLSLESDHTHQVYIYVVMLDCYACRKMCSFFILILWSCNICVIMSFHCSFKNGNYSI